MMWLQGYFLDHSVSGEDAAWPGNMPISAAHIDGFIFYQKQEFKE